MRHVAVTIAALLMLPTVGAQAGPRCRDVATDARRDTYAFAFGSSAYDEPGMDITAVNFRLDRQHLVVVTSLADVDAPMATAPLGRTTRVFFDVGEGGFAATLTQAVDTTEAYLTVSLLDTGAKEGPASGSVWAGNGVGRNLRFRIDTARNQVRIEVPLSLLRRYAGAIHRGGSLTLRDAMTAAVLGASEASVLNPADRLGRTARWRLGAPSCA